MKNEVMQRITTSCIAGLFFFGSYIISPLLFCGVLLIVLGYILLYEWPALIAAGKRSALLSPSLALFTLCYPTLPIISLIYLVRMYYHYNWLVPLYPFIVAWGFDTLAYVSGKLVGRHKICPSISPGKTWEGFIGGTVGIVILHRYLFSGLDSVYVLLIALFVSSFAFAGDLFESYLKRRVSIKDSGSFLPGHGGLLDRFDSVFFVAPAIVVLDLVIEGGLKDLLLL